MVLLDDDDAASWLLLGDMAGGFFFKCQENLLKRTFENGFAVLGGYDIHFILQTVLPSNMSAH